MGIEVVLIKGDGVGPEVSKSVVDILDAAECGIEWIEVEAGLPAIERYGTPLPENVIDIVKDKGVALKGPVTTPVGKGFRSVNVTLRQSLDLYVNLRPVRSLPGVASRYKDVDLVIVRENTEGLYKGIEYEVVDGVVESIKVITRTASLRIAKFAFEYAVRKGRKKVTAAHKANIMKMVDGLFLQCFREVAEKYPDIEADEKIIDNLCMQLVLNPDKFDVLVMENFYGDVVSDLAAGLVGGLGVAPGANIGDKIGVFEAVHGSAPDIAGKGIANPIALLQSAILMLEYLSLDEKAELVYKALCYTLECKGIKTPDLGGTATTEEFTKAVIDSLEKV